MTPSPDSARTAAATPWRENRALVQLLALSPLLAVTTSVVNGLALGLATLAVLLVTNTTLSLVDSWVLPRFRTPLFVLVAAAVVTAIDLLCNALFDDLHEALGLYLALIVANCALLARADTAAARLPVLHAVLAGIATGLGALGTLVLIGGLRELVGHGTLLAGASMLLGPRAAGFELDAHFAGVLVAVLPPGAFLCMAALLAIRARLARPRPTPPP
ncbi:MAG TPA: electron transport complex subunit RsxE [Gammaproteobacteria bacterium]|nr:electron transport complex subunit RsxE [Gammaproteobacteria bacterium]